jgi:ABC-type lipoprotein release transport system permease subunit
MVGIGATLGYGAASALVRILSAVAAPVADQFLPVAKNLAVAVGVPVFLITLAAIACYVPARRSASIDPVLTLREE